MAGPISRAAYTLGQSARVGLYWSQYWLTARLTTPVKAPRPITGRFPGTRRVLADLRDLLQRDWRNIEAGYYRVPHDLAETPLNALVTAGRYFADLMQVERRRHARDSREVRRDGPRRDDLPAYYLQNFHYQTDGYLSRRSAELYDHQVEVLFGGGADAMRRQALVPLHDVLEGRRSSETRLLDLACGTGRFLTFVKDNYPRLQVTALDLSPAYLAKARALLKPWSQVDFVEAAAEATGLPDRSCDVVTCVYLFHELPRKVRAEVAREIARVLKPGGKLIFLDSLQLGDEPDYDGLLEYFPVAFHEPYYADYVRQDLAALFAAAGLTVERVERAYLSRLMVLAKPQTRGYVNRSVTAAR
jgi:ubiquinone/menaquinone biosynthesis C-methylase UbiE